MTELLLHPDSKQRIEALQDSPPQSLLLYGEPGVGLMTIARAIAGKAPIVVMPEGESQALSIKTERIRQLYDETKGAATKRQFVIIDEADLMTHGAQSAFLKLLEEPGHNMHFILTSHDKDNLLPTIVSRVQAHYMPLPTAQAVQVYINQSITDPEKRRKVSFLASRQPSLVSTYANDSEIYTRDSELMSDARKCITAQSPYDKQVVALKYASTRTVALKFIDACLHLLQYSLTQDAADSSIVMIDRFLNTRDDLLKNINVKLALAQLMV